MKKTGSYFLLLLFVFIGIPEVRSQTNDDLRIDPSLLISLKESRNITKTIGFYPGWEFEKTSVLFYRPGVQEILINFPKKPNSFKEFKDDLILKNEMIFFRNDKTIIPYDDQNTTKEINGVPVLVVADPFSRMRNQIRGTIQNQPPDFVSNWLDEWNFIQNPYDEIRLILHEGFHIHQGKMAPDKYANEGLVSEYPLLNEANNALYVLEGLILRDLLLSDLGDHKLEKIKEFVAVRNYRQSLLDEEFVEYENRNEFLEGTAKYIEYKFLQMNNAVEPIPEMYYQNGFNGYKNVLPDLFKREIEDMVKIVSVSDNRFGNRFGTGPMKFRLYSLGACQALLLDEVMPEWKTIIFDENIYLCNLLKDAIDLTESENTKYLSLAKEAYSYDQILKDKRVFKQEGEEIIRNKTDAILKTENTLVTIHYADFSEDLRMYYTPFGITKISESAKIYDMMPITVTFKEGVILKMKNVNPVLVDKEKKEVSFAILSNKIETGISEMLDLDEFSLGGTKMNIEKVNNHYSIHLIN